MSDSEHGRNSELADLLREVRELRQELEQLKSGQSQAGVRDPNYSVLAVTGAARDPDYSVLVRQSISPEEAVSARASLREPSYEVLVRQDIAPEDPAAQ